MIGTFFVIHTETFGYYQKYSGKGLWYDQSCFGELSHKTRTYANFNTAKRSAMGFVNMGVSIVEIYNGQEVKRYSLNDILFVDIFESMSKERYDEITDMSAEAVEKLSIAEWDKYKKLRSVLKQIKQNTSEPLLCPESGIVKIYEPPLYSAINSLMAFCNKNDGVERL